VESGLTNWGSTAGSLTRNTQLRRSGNASAQISGRTATWNGLTFSGSALTQGTRYDVSVWVRLAAGAPNSAVMLTAKRQDDSDPNTYSEYTRVASATASANEWTRLQGFYTQTGTPFQHFIIESDNATVSYYADDFSIGGNGHPFFVGNITTSGAVRSDFMRYWNQITPENEGKWGSVERTRGVYDWTALDRIYAFARQNGIPVKAHTFVWGNQAPSWINSLSPAEQAVAIENWIRSYCTRYPDTAMIDVVNEATPGHAPAEYARRAFGENWIIRSFQIARQHCPNAILILNDYNVLSWDTQAFINMARPAVQAGVVDAIGLQAHGLESWSLPNLRANMDRVAALGLPIYISEYDIARTDDQTQLRIMQEQFPYFFSHPQVRGITLWGYVVGRTWVNGSGLIYDDGRARPAMTWLMDYLRSRPGDTSCDLPTRFSWTSTPILVSPQRANWASVKDPSVVKYNDRYHVFATVFDTARGTGGAWGSVHLNFSDWAQAGSAAQTPFQGTRMGDAVAPQVFFFRPQNRWYQITQWPASYATTTDVGSPSSWSAKQRLLQGEPAGALDYWVICNETHCHLFFSRDDGVLYMSKTTIGNFPNFSGYTEVMRDNRGDGASFLFEAPNVYKVDGTNQYLLLVEAYRSPGYGPRYFRSWSSTSLDGPWTPLADTEENPFAGNNNVEWPQGRWATHGISHGELVRSGFDERLTVDPCNLEFLYQGETGPAASYDRIPYRLGLLRLKR
jgi:GH35 family endo-1,4-beta-xylanase